MNIRQIIPQIELDTGLLRGVAFEFERKGAPWQGATLAVAKPLPVKSPWPGWYWHVGTDRIELLLAPTDSDLLWRLYQFAIESGSELPRPCENLEAVRTWLTDLLAWRPADEEDLNRLIQIAKKSFEAQDIVSLWTSSRLRPGRTE